MTLAAAAAVFCIIFKIKVVINKERKRSFKGEFLLAVSLMVAFFTGLFTSSKIRAGTVINSIYTGEAMLFEIRAEEKIQQKWNKANKGGLISFNIEKEKREMKNLLEELEKKGEFSSITSEAILYMYGMTLKMNSIKEENTPQEPDTTPLPEPEETPYRRPTCYMPVNITDKKTPLPSSTPTAIPTLPIPPTCYMPIMPTPSVPSVTVTPPLPSPTPTAIPTPPIPPTCYMPIMPTPPVPPVTVTPPPFAKTPPKGTETLTPLCYTPTAAPSYTPTPDDHNMCYLFFRLNSGYSGTTDRKELEKKLALIEELEEKGFFTEEIMGEVKKKSLQKLEFLNKTHTYLQAEDKEPETTMMLQLYEQNTGGIKEGKKVEEDLIKAVEYIKKLEKKRINSLM